MKKLCRSQSAIGVIAVLVWSLLGSVSAGQAADGVVNFIATDEPGPWFKCVGDYGCIPKSVALTESLAIVPPNTKVRITIGTETNTVHTFTSLVYPTGARNMPFDQKAAFNGNRSVTLQDPGLYVFVCKLHPFMLAATIVDNPTTVAQPPLPAGPAYDLGESITLVNGITVPTNSDLASRLVRAFFLITNPTNYQNHNSLTNPTPGKWNVTLPGVVVQRTGANDQVLLSALNIVNADLPSLSPPTTAGIGEVWIDTEFEKTAKKAKPGTATALDTSTWKVTKKVALPEINMNNPHNMWTNRDQTRIYQTQWFDNKLTVFNRITGSMIKNIPVGEAPAHVMTRVDTDQVHVSLNGEDAVIELNPGRMEFSRRIFTQYPGDLPAQPHAHWMSFDGKTMVTPNSNTNDSTRIDLVSGRIKAKTETGTLPIATGMMPDASKYYVSNYLDSTITCISIGHPACKADGGGVVRTKDINLLANYNAVTGAITGPVGALPIQTPVSPDGKFVVTANTLTGTITIIDTATDKLVAMLACSAGCHGVNFGAKKDGGYYAYVSSKFSNDLIIVDLSTKTIAGRVLLAVADADVPGLRVHDDTPTLYQGMGGQGVLPIPLVYNGWVQNLPRFWKSQLTEAQRHPFPQDEHEHD